VADAVAVDAWSGRGVRLDDVVGALSVLRDQSNIDSSARTAVMTLIAVAPTDEQAYAATHALRSLAGHHPARIIILRPDADQVAGLDGRTTLYSLAGEERRINFEEVILTVRGQAAHHLDSLVEAFTLSDLPVAVWYVSSIPEPTDPLLTVATAVLLDSRDAADDRELRSLLELARRRIVVDLSWNRLAPWRELLASLFDPPQSREWIHSVEGVEVTGKSGPRRLLGGWLTRQFVLSPRQVVLRNARHVEITVTCRRDGQEAVFSVTRGEGVRTVAAQATFPAGRPIHLSAPLAEDPLPTSLATALTHLVPDPIWENALFSATSLTP
jgi:glucose-6-phosphate dehydrogenase assembly protein OpcA